MKGSAAWTRGASHRGSTTPSSATAGGACPTSTSTWSALCSKSSAATWSATACSRSSAEWPACGSCTGPGGCCGDREVGLIAAALLAVSPFALQLSRQAGESTPTQALWAAGFYYLCLALRYRKPLDWALAGTLWGLSLYFYASGKLIMGILAVVIVYCLVRWRLLFFKRYALGFALMVFAFGLTFAPNVLSNISDGWHNFTYRSQQTAIFAPTVQLQVFQHFGIPFDHAWTFEPLLQSVTSHPREWAQLLWTQARVSTEVLYSKSDPSFYYQIQDHNGSLLSPHRGRACPARARLRRMEDPRSPVRAAQYMVLGRHAGRDPDHGRTNSAAHGRGLARLDALPRCRPRPGCLIFLAHRVVAGSQVDGDTLVRPP